MMCIITKTVSVEAEGVGKFQYSENILDDTAELRHE